MTEVTGKDIRAAPPRRQIAPRTRHFLKSRFLRAFPSLILGRKDYFCSFFVVFPMVKVSLYLFLALAAILSVGCNISDSCQGLWRTIQSTALPIFRSLLPRTTMPSTGRSRQRTDRMHLPNASEYNSQNDRLSLEDTATLLPASMPRK